MGFARGYNPPYEKTFPLPCFSVRLLQFVDSHPRTKGARGRCDVDSQIVGGGVVAVARHRGRARRADRLRARRLGGDARGAVRRMGGDQAYGPRDAAGGGSVRAGLRCGLGTARSSRTVGSPCSPLPVDPAIEALRTLPKGCEHRARSAL
jgi:hypothetical protein